MVIAVAGFRHDATGRSTRKLASARERDCLGPPKDEGWAFLPLSLLESPVHHSLSINAHRVLFRLMVEHLHHSRLENGNLRVSARQFYDWGVTKAKLTDAIRELEEKGLIKVRVGEATGILRPPSVYQLTFYGTSDGNKPTNEWKRWQGESWPNTPVGPDMIDAPKSRGGLAGISGRQTGPKRRAVSLEVGAEAVQK